MKKNTNYKKNDKNKFQGGFTLIETFVAITVLLIAVTGPLVLVTKALSISKMSKGQTTAIYLAQEAVEYIRNVRDENILNRVYWLENLDECMELEGDKCKINSIDEEVEACSSDGCRNLSYNSSNYLYGYGLGGSWVESRFKRDVEIIEVTSNKEVEIIVDMFWSEGPNTVNFSINERLFNWQ
ncbi:MAG: hypothetical protein KAJ58_00880 [Candidatus Pacebacteria bacterium]|nr:hypothetical protein [Candidatus Paceibacterota bacterium]